MRKILAFFVFLMMALQVSAFAGYVRGYTRSNGTYVSGYNRSSGNGTVTDNYSFVGNTNPYTGSTGTNYYRHDSSSPYYDGSNQ